MNNSAVDNTENVSLIRLLEVLWKDKLIILVTSLCAALIAIYVSIFILPEKYKSQVLMMPADMSSMNTTSSSICGLASLAGVSLAEETTEASVALEVIKSRLFTKEFIKKREILVPLIAAKGWDKSSNKLIIDNDLYDESSEKWVRNVSFPKKTIPNDQEAFKFWKDEVFSISQDRKTGYISMSIEFFSPHVSKDWATWIVEDINNTMRDQAVKEAQLSIEYLNNELNSTTSEELKSLFYLIIKDNTEKIMLAYSRPEYVFKVIDPPIAPYLKSYPQRLIIVISSTIIGFFIGIFISLIRNFLRNRT